MSDLFAEYELLSRSELFDPTFYVDSYPAAARSNQDPLMHYVERGGRERLNPSAGFNTEYYLKQCEAFGETPLNPLYHYLTIGVTRGLAPSPNSNLLTLDIPKIVTGRAEAPAHGGLSIVGWAIAAGGVETVDVAIDGRRVASAHHGLHRPDVAAAHPSRHGALLSGFATHLPPKAVPVGDHRVSVSLLSRNGQVNRIDFALTVADRPSVAGPSVLRRKMPQAEVDLKLGLLRQLNASPRFHVILSVSSSPADILVARQTLRTLTRQTYPHWHLALNCDPHTSARSRQKLLQTITAPFESVRGRVTLLEDSARARPRRKARPNQRSFHLFLAPGDELGCDALLEFAVAGAMEPDTRLWYSDDRRALADGNPDAAGSAAAFFKPAWSPDLLLSFNYLGRAWCIETDAIEGRLEELAAATDYDRVLHVSEACEAPHRIGHVPKVLHQHSERVPHHEVRQSGPTALIEALKRRGIQAEVSTGKGSHGFRVRRQTPTPKVSVIIPTRAAGGLVQRCLESLRDITAYRNFDVLCIENIPTKERLWREWLSARVDSLISTREPFNWSRFNNLAAARASGDLLLFLNDDTEIIDSDWMHALVEHAQRPEVGTAGALLLYPDRSVQHAGFVLDHAGRGRHAFRHLREDDPGYFGLAHCTRNVIGSTGACLMTRREVFARLHGFDEDHSVINNDLDYCLRAMSQDLLNVYTPYARLIHHELASRASVPESYDPKKFLQRWRGVIAGGDPYFNPNLSREHDQLVVEAEPPETLVAGHPRFARSTVRRILVVKLDHIGDCVVALPAVRRLKQYFPKARISVLAGRATRPVWDTEPAVDEVIPFEFFHARSGQGRVPVSPSDLAALQDRLHRMAFDLAIDLRKQPDSREVLQISGAEILIGFDCRGRFPWLDVALEWDEDVPLRAKHGHVADDLVTLVDALRAHSEEPRAKAQTRPTASLSLPPTQQRKLFARPLICVHPAAGSVMRQWPLEKFAELIDLLLDLGDYNVALIGGPDEIAVAREVLNGSEVPEGSNHRRPKSFDLTGRLPLEQLPTLLARSALFVGNNSGPQHLAAAAGIPTIGIHSGVVDAKEWGPLGPRAVAVRKDMICSPCFLEFPEHCQRGLACLRELPVGYVYRACLQALGRAPKQKAQHCSEANSA